MGLDEGYLRGIQENNNDFKKREAARLKALKLEKAKKAKLRRILTIAVAAYLTLVNLLTLGHTYDKLASERGGKKYFHKDIGSNYVLKDAREITIGDILEEISNNPADLIFPTWVFEDSNERNIS